MRISHTVASMQMPFSGVTVCVQELLHQQQIMGHTAEVCTLYESKETSVKTKNNKIYCHDLKWIPIIKRLYRSKELEIYLKSGQQEIIHTHGIWSLPNTYRKSKKQRKRSVFAISPHGMLSEVALTFSTRKKKLFNSFYQQKAFDDADLIFATSESEYNDIRNFGIRKPVALIPNGVSLPNKISHVANNKSKILLSLGRIHPKKGLDTLINAWSCIEEIYPEWELKIVGPDECGHRKNLERLITEKGLQRVQIEEGVYGHEKTLIMQQASLFILPSKSENFGMTVLESLALGVPVIATYGTPWEDLIKQDCGWWTSGDIYGLTQILKSTLCLPTDRLQKMGEKGRNWVTKDFSWKDIAFKTVAAYQWALDKREKPDFVILN